MSRDMELISFCGFITVLIEFVNILVRFDEKKKGFISFFIVFVMSS